ncbi:hypothetical protein [Leptospira noguchii]|uniref:hypothetical protein n=1 Tax=Leptospira noguchii TaxID=28182 RepID=UPI001FB7980C|nr:hypothetical protein [Leptospira noguchii]UOG32799.1 hypothetical protein MAL06_21120 [Leptospira noguchii]
MLLVQSEIGQLQIDQYPGVCPYCHHAIAPKFFSAALSGDALAESTFLDVAYKCTHIKCFRLFISVYRKSILNGDREFRIKKSYPISFKNPVIPNEIKEISNNFEKIYTEAFAAESMNLDEIAGVGFRKALEFLIKDYCIYKNESKSDEIKTLLLVKVIDQYIDDMNIKSCAKRAAWLGNDETHYIRKWEDRDINDLKTLITLTINWIVNNIMTEKYLREMSN